MSSEDLTVLLKLGDHYLNKVGNLDRAELIYKECIVKFPHDFRAYFNTGGTLLRYGDKSKESGALLAYSSALERNPGIIETYGCISGLYIKCCQPDKCAIVCYHGLLVDPCDRTCLYNMNIALRQLGRMDEAIDYTWKVFDLILTKDKGVVHHPKSKVERSDLLLSGSESEKDSSITYCCVKWGGKYDASYVNSLYRSIQKHDDADKIRMICFTDDDRGIDDSIECNPLPDLRWRGWWFKGAIFSKALSSMLRGWVVYLDLDAVVCSSMNIWKWNWKLGEGNGEIGGEDGWKHNTIYLLSAEGIANEQRKEGLNSSIMIWHNHGAISFSFLYDFLESYYREMNKLIYKFDHYLEMMLVSNPNINFVYLQRFFPGKIVDYPSLLAESESSEDKGSIEEQPSTSTVEKALLNQNGKLLDLADLGIAIVCFPLNPKPAEIVEKYSWIDEYFKEPLR